jgi:hypothetical protein
MSSSYVAATAAALAAVVSAASPPSLIAGAIGMATRAAMSLDVWTPPNTIRLDIRRQCLSLVGFALGLPDDDGKSCQIWPNLDDPARFQPTVWYYFRHSLSLQTISPFFFNVFQEMSLLIMSPLSSDASLPSGSLYPSLSADCLPSTTGALSGL